MNKELTKALLKRVFTSLVVLFLLITFVFFLLRISPGDPSQKFISPRLSPELAKKVRESFNLNSSVWVQYEAFVINLIKGNLGISYNYRMPVTSVIWEYLPFTLVFASISFIIQILSSFFLALATVKKRNGILDRTISKASLAVYASPSFVIGVILIFLFSEKLKLFPSSGLRSFDASSYSLFQNLTDYFNHLVLPVITLALPGTALFYKYLRDNLEDIYNKPFIINLRALGFTEKEITRKHIVPNAVNPLISVAGIELGILFSGALITEVIFALPGMGRLTINAILTRDYPLVVGCSLAAGILIILSNLAADIIRANLDKRLVKGSLN
jgi:peptide/nickel transport system permease protein